MILSEFKNFSLKFIASAVILSCVVGTTIATNINNEDTENVKTKYTREDIIMDKNPAMADYIAQSKRKIKNNWYPPADDFENSATVVVTLERSGKLLKCVLLEPSPSERFNNSLIEAVNKTKFSPLPREYANDFVDIDYTFNMQKRHIEK